MQKPKVTKLDLSINGSRLIQDLNLNSLGSTRLQSAECYVLSFKVISLLVLKIFCYQLTGSEDFLRFLPYMGVAAMLVSDPDHLNCPQLGRLQ